MDMIIGRFIAPLNSSRAMGIVRAGVTTTRAGKCRMSVRTARNTVIGPGYADLDAGLVREVRLPRGTRIQLRWEIFNLLNHTNFDTPDRTFGTANFGRIFSAEPAREMQFGIKFLFW